MLFLKRHTSLISTKNLIDQVEEFPQRLHFVAEGFDVVGGGISTTPQG